MGSNPQGNPVAEVTRTEHQTLSFSNVHKVGTWNVRSMNQGKVDVIKREMERTRTENLGISKLRWTALG